VAALAGGAATNAGSWGIVGHPELVPVDISQWVGHVAVCGLVAAIVVATRFRTSELRAWCVRSASAIALLTCYLVVRPLLSHRWSTSTRLACS